MSISSSLKERFGQRVQYVEGSRVQSGFPARYRLLADANFVKKVSAASTLARRHVPLRVALDAVDRLVLEEQVTIDLPMLEDAAAFESELRALGITAAREEAAAAAAAEG